jgi:hypothetical protein
MNQAPLLRWIKAAEARRIRVLAEEDPGRITIAPASPNAQPFNALLASLRQQLCVNGTTRRLSRVWRNPTR